MEVDIFLITEEGKKYTLDVPQQIYYKSLKDIIIDKIIKHSHFQIAFRGKKYTEKNKYDVLNFNVGDIIFSIITVTNECHTANVEFHLDAKLDESDMSVVELSGILQICLLKYIARNIVDVNKITSKEIRNIIIDLKNTIGLTDNPKEDIKSNLMQKEGSNIITYINYIKHIVNEKEIRNLISLFDKNHQNQIKNYWSQLSKYEDFNKLFQKDFLEAIEKSYFDYSLVGVSIYQQEKRRQYINDLKECENTVVKYLFHGTQIDPISKIITEGFLYTRKAFYGMGIYFSDMLDYISFYCGGETYEERRKNFGKVLPVGQTFSCVGTEIFYDKDKKEDVFDWKYKVKELDHFPTYDELKSKYPDKMVEKNGIHFARVEPQHGQVIETEELIYQEKKKGKFIGNEYVITEKSQMLPLYGLTLKRNEYFVIWRDPNFVGQNEYRQYLENAKMILYKNEGINVYIESCTEKALNLIKRKKFNKIILISSIGLDLSGKKFVETARKILGFNVVVLFFSANNRHLKWIQNFPNALYTNNTSFYEKYVKNYNKEGLLQLKKEIEQAYKINLKFTQNFLEFPNFINNEKFNNLIFEDICPNFRKVIIKNKNTKKALLMNEDRTVEFVSYEITEISSLLWYVTLIDNEITLFSNNSYLFVDENSKIVKGDQYMKRWKYEKINNQFLIYYENKNNILINNENKAIINSNNNNQLFDLIDDISFY